MKEDSRMSSGGAVSGEERKGDLPPPEKKQKTESSDYDSVSNLPPHARKHKSESDTDSDPESDCGSDCGSTDYSGSDSEPCVRQVTEDELTRYSESVFESGGFDVIDLPDVLLVGSIVPMCSDEKYLSEDKYLKRSTKAAIKDYNSRYMPKRLEFVKIVKAMSQVTRGRRFYITFEANDAADNGITKTYQAVVLYGLEDLKVQSLRLKPQGDQGSTKGWFWESHIYKGDDDDDDDDAES